jgi:formate hydrogenlyase transcriptional activator
MLEFNNAVVSQLDLEALLKSIFDCVRVAFQQTTAATISIYDPEIDQLRVHLLHSDDPDLFKKGMPLPIEGTPSALAFTSHQVVLIRRLVLEEFPADLIKRAIDDGIKSACSVPLMSRDRVVGVLTVAAPTENAFSEADADLLAQVGLQIAIPIENALNLQQANRERDRNQLLVEIGQAVASSLRLKDLFRTVSSLLQRFINHDMASFVLKDRDTGELRVHMLDRPPSDIGREGMVIPLEGTPAGLCISSRSTIRRETVDFEEFYDPVVRMAHAAGVRSGCSVPLIAGDEVLGAINVGSFREAGFSKEDAALLEQIARPVAIATQNILNFRRAELERDRKRLLLNINNAIVTNLSLADLLKAITETLGRMVPHDAASLSLYDPVRKQFRMHTFSMNYQSSLQTGIVFPAEGTPAGRVLQTHETVRLPVIDPKEYPADIVAHAVRDGLRSGCSIPLIVHDEFLGVLEIASRRENAFSEYDAGLLKHIARQIAIATQNTLNFERANRERSRAQTLLEINNAITTNLELDDLIHATAACLRTHFKNDFAGMSLYDEESGQLMVHSLDSSKTDDYLIAGARFDIEGTLNGLAFTTGKPIVRNHIEPSESSWALAQKFFAEQGLKSAVFIPMISGGRTVGVLNLGSRTENAFSESDVELLVSIARQIAIAVQNSLNFGRARDFEQRAKRERDRIGLLLEINNALVSTLDLNEVVKNVSASLRDVMPHDAAGIALYEPEHNHLREYTNVHYTEMQTFRVGDTIAIEGTPAGEVFTTGKAKLIKRPNLEDYPADRYSQNPTEGSPKSACLALLQSHGRKLGIAGVSSREVDKFTEGDLEFFSQIAGQIALAVENSLQYREIEALKNRLAGEKHYLEEEIKTRYNFSEIVGQSTALKEVLQQIETVAPTDSTVLLIGETGTGKELIARAIHNLSARNERTLVKLNCAAIPTGLLESELFGHEKGAFTGAIAARVGRFELANKGTLLLDEIGEIPLELQPKLLRVLQEHEFERLGSSRTVKTDARLIAATNCDLAQMVAEKTFRSDLYYRLNVFPIMIPPLRERTGDIPLLVGYFAQKHAGRMNKKIQSVPAEVMQALCKYHWPGNVRELENFIERSVILSRGAELTSPLSELGVAAEVSADGNGGAAKPKLTTMDEMERLYIEEVLRHVNGAVAGKGGAAEILGMPASTLRSRMKKLGIR